MRTIEYGTTTHVPAFLTKLWKLVTDAACDELISWSLAGTSFIIFDEIRFSKELLPMYFKHNNMASFVRQLNMYGFRKLSCIDQGGMHCFKNEIEFYHQYFIKGQESLLELIKRKIPNSKSEEPKVKQEYIDELIANIKSLRGKQDSAEQGMRTLRRENRMLWRHVNLLTDRYTKQQSVLQQLLPFFVNMVRSSREVSLKRKTPLMIDEGDVRAKIARMSPPYYVEHDQDTKSGMPSSPGNVSNRGPVIHDVTEMESSKMYPANILCPPITTTTKECEAIVDSPLSCSLESSEQTIDSPYNEPGSMETLNILNQNFERSRSNCLSPHMEMKHSPTSIANSPLQLPSQACAMPAAQSSMVNYTAVPNGLSPVAIIDESTSDVPIEGLMRIPFVPKIEDTCSNSGMYTIDCMVNSTNSVLSRPSMLNENTSSLMNDRSPMLNEGTPSLMAERSPMLNEGTSSMMADRSQLLNESTTVMRNRPSMINERTSLMNEETSPIINERCPLVNERASSIMNEQSINEGSASVKYETGPSSSANKFLPHGFISSIKSSNGVQDINWMMNSFGNEPYIENWLGSIFKADNLVAGCSLPHQEQTESVPT